MGHSADEYTTKLILFLDGNPDRAAMAYHKMAKEDRDRVIWCRTSNEAILTLNDYSDNLEAVYLEHDLEIENMHPGNEKSGMEVIRSLEKMKKNDIDKFKSFRSTYFIVHTWNEYAGPKMVCRLKQLDLKVDLRPFGS